MTIQDICRLSEEVRAGELLEAVFIDQAIKDPKSREADAGFVLRATYPTAPLRSLAEFLARKLSREHPKGAAVIRGDYGSGKSHALLALYHLASLGMQAKEWLDRWRVTGGFPQGTRVALVQLVSENPETFWELLFERTGRPELNAQVRNYPTRELWEELCLTAETPDGSEFSRPTLLIIDEMELWFRQLDNGRPKERARAGLQNLLEAANRSEVSLAVALSVYGREPRLMEIINRTQPPSWDVGTAEDRRHIVRHRLIADFREDRARKVVERYVQTYESAQSEFPSLAGRLGALEREMLDTYPFHPAFLDQAYQVYAAAPHHESTRGIIYLCANLLRRHAGERDLILAGDLDIRDQHVASDLRKLDPDLVSNAHEDLTRRCGEIAQAGGILGTVLLHSFAPVGAGGATLEQVLAGTLRPQLNVNELLAEIEHVRRESWFLDELEGRLVVTKEVVLLKQLEQQARSLIEKVEDRGRAEDKVREGLRELLSPETVFLYPESPFPEALGGTSLKYVVSLDPMTEEEAEALLRGRDNTIVLIAPKPALRGRLTQDREMLLRAARLLVAESLLTRRTERHSDLRGYKARFEREFRHGLADCYGYWMRLSRTNELGTDPEYVIRKISCALSADAIRAAILQENDVEVIKGGLQKLLRLAGLRARKGSEAAGETIGQLRRDLRRYPGLPVLVGDGQLMDALRSMARDGHPQTGIVLSVGKALYGYDDRALPALSDDCRVWLKMHAPEPPAPQDVKNAVRSGLADAAGSGVPVQRIQDRVCRDTGAPQQDVLRALAELVNEGEAVLEQAESRFPDDGDLSSGMMDGRAVVWLQNYAPPDDRRARQSILRLVQDAGDEGIGLGDLEDHLALEDIERDAFRRGLQRLLADRAVEAQVAGQETTPALIRDLSLLEADALIRVPLEKSPPPSHEPFRLHLGPYRLLDQLQRELHDRLREEACIQSARFEATPMGETPDPLFGRDEELARLARVAAQHQLEWEFSHPISKAAFLQVTRNLFQELERSEGIVISVEVHGNAPR
ncbi:MAG: hypothetical protein ACUVXG_13145 [Anaerolineae bacterium]